MVMGRVGQLVSALCALAALVKPHRQPKASRAASNFWRIFFP
jgi:hypothetical protein